MNAADRALHGRLPASPHTSTARLFLFAALTLGLAFPLSAQAQSCGQGGGKGSDISICADEILEEQERSLNLLDQMTSEMAMAGMLQADQKSAADRQLEFLRRGHARGRKEKNDATSDEFDSLAVKGEATDCQLRLLPRYSMGPPPRPICSDEDVAANKCEEVCEFTADEKERNAQRGLRLEEDLADALEQTKAANDEMESSMGSITALSYELAAADAAACAFDSPHPNVDPFPPASIMFHNQLLVAQETITDIGKGGCQQDAAGFNASTACIALDVLKGIQKGLTEYVNTINGNFTSAKVDATFECVSGLKSDSEEQGEQIDEIEQKVGELSDQVAELKEMLDEVRTLLTTPQGRREGFPSG